MEVVVTHTAKDYRAAIRHTTRRMFANSPTRHIATAVGSLFGFFLVISAVLLGQFLNRYSGPDRDFVTYALGGVILAFVCGVSAKPVYQVLVARLMYRRNGNCAGPQRFSIEEDALVHRWSSSSARFAWSDIDKIETTDEHIFAFLDRSQAIYIAKRAFTDREALTAFLNELNARVAASKA
jgi:hypothetical protein